MKMKKIVLGIFNRQIKNTEEISQFIIIFGNLVIFCLFIWFIYPSYMLAWDIGEGKSCSSRSDLENAQASSLYKFFSVTFVI